MEKRMKSPRRPLKPARKLAPPPTLTAAPAAPVAEPEADGGGAPDPIVTKIEQVGLDTKETQEERVLEQAEPIEPEVEVEPKPVEAHPLVLEARFERTAYTADQNHEALLALSVKAVEAASLPRQRRGLDLVVLLDTSPSMSADGWLGACTTTLRYLLQHRLDERDRVSLLLFDATTQTAISNKFEQATQEGKQRLEALLGAGMASRPSRIGFKETLHQAIGYETEDTSTK